jgi:hypothetical protein
MRITVWLIVLGISVGLAGASASAADIAAPSLEQEAEHAAGHAGERMFELAGTRDQGLLLAQKKSERKKVAPRKGKAVKKKKTHNSRKTVRRKPRATSLEKSRSRVLSDFVEYVSIGVVGFALFGLYLRYRKEFGESLTDNAELAQAPPVATQPTPFGAYQAKAVVLDEPGGPDPATFEQTDVFQKVAAAGRKPSVALDLTLDGPELEKSISDEIDLLISSIKVKEDPLGATPAQMFLLPAEMMGHFEGMPYEHLVWSAPIYIKGVCEGQLAITNMRILALYERRHLRLWPPALIYQTKRNQMRLDQISLYKHVQVNRPSFLAAGACVFWWFPFGTIGAVAAIAAYLFLTRRELGVWTSSQKRTYPLSMVDAEEAMSSIARATGLQPLGRNEPVKQGRKAG